MDSSRRALQTNVTLSPNFKFVLELLAENQKNIQTNSKVWILIKVQYVLY